MKKSTKLAIALPLLSLCSFSTSAALNGYPVVLVHGFQAGDLSSKPNADKVTSNGQAYWQAYWDSFADERLDWPSHERISGKIATDYIWPKIKKLSQDGTCQSGCIFVTHSTGDLVTRYLIDNQANWLTNAGLEPLNIVATFDFAGAGGGSELADLAHNVTEGSGAVNASLRWALSLWLGETPTQGNIGVLNDLRVNTARQLAPFPSSQVPRLRFVGDGSDFFGATGGFLPGHDDGVVSSHSACGATEAGSFGSCSTTTAFDGKQELQSNAVNAFMPYHYPLLMGEDYSHNGTIAPKQQGKLTVASSSAQFSDGKTLSFDTKDVESGWFSRSTYRYVIDSENTAMSQTVVNALN